MKEKKRGITEVFLVVFLCAILFGECSAVFRIGSFNVQIFGQKKSKETAVMEVLAKVSWANL